MTIVPREWERDGFTASRATRVAELSRVQVAFATLGVVCVILGVAVLAQGEIVGLGAVLFGAGYLARALWQRAGVGGFSRRN